MRISTVGALSCFALVSMGQPVVARSSKMTQGNGVQVEASRPVDGVENVNADGWYRLEILKSDQYRLVVSGDGNIVPLVQTSVRNGTLFVSGPESIEPRIPLTVKVFLPNLRAASIAGAVSGHIGAFSGDAIRISARGTVAVSSEALRFDKLYVQLSGSSSLRIEGHAREAAFEVDGASRFDGESFTAESARVSVLGASRMTLGACGELAGSIEGASRVKYHGTRASSSAVRVSIASSIRYSTP